ERKMAPAKSDPNCVEPACASKMDFFKSSVGKKNKGSGTAVAAAGKPKATDECPLSREELGNATWGLSRMTFSMWLCEQHNIVNRKIHRPTFECTMENLEERWRKGKPSCWGEDADPEATAESLGKGE
ncbi:hypothetical protein BBJ28_00026639, partial [Nothophytophthora sp. Chile5]